MAGRSPSRGRRRNPLCKCGQAATFGSMCPSCAREKAKIARERAAKIRAAAFNPGGARVSTYRLETASGRPIRKATKVTFADGQEVRFLDRVPKKKAIREALAQLGKNPGRGASSVYSMAVSLGYPYLRGEGRVAKDGRTWLSRVTKKSDGTGPAIFVGWDSAKRKWVIENPSGKDVPATHKKRVDAILAKMPKPIRDAFERNPRRMQVFFDPAIKKYTAIFYDSHFGNLYASGHTKKQAAAALHERVREARRAGTHRNPDAELDQAADLYREFHGREPKEILEIQESDLARREYTALGDVVELRFILPDGRRLNIAFSESDKVKLASSPDGRQLYFLGGDQDIAGALAANDVDTSRELIDLGDAVFVSYDASKWQTDFKPTIWEHKLGEESGIYPRGFFDKLQRRLFVAGGNYRVERPGIID